MCCLYIDQFVNIRYFLMHLHQIKIIRQGNVAVNMKVGPILLCPKVVDINPGIMPVSLQDCYNILYQVHITFIHQSAHRSPGELISIKNNV
ncbi:hypothetical protein D3C85_1498030 [compost metagenome]